jgi:PPK2 family polyphosphate:nucleotide phosphotransferase
MSYAIQVEPGSKVDLSKLDPDHHAGLEKDEGRKLTEKLANEISELQTLMYAAKETSLLCVFQAMDTGGKDGAINKALSYLNVQSCRATYFKVPTPDEVAHDFLWRIHAQVPGRGGITLFNRSHYEDVLVVRVHELVPQKEWQRRFGQINEFERLLTSNETIILKFYLHISKEEQAERLQAREDDPLKSWKLSVQDWKEREFWDDYMRAYEDALSKCSTPHAPWLIVPANHKWYRDLAIAEAIAGALRPFRKRWTSDLEKAGKKALAEIDAYRKSISG